MRLHRSHHHALGKLQKALVERPFQNGHALDQVHDLLEHAARIAPAARRRVEARHDLAAPLFGIRLDPCTAKPLDVLARVWHFDRTVGEAMAEGCVADRRLAVELGKQPAHWAREANAALVPAHRLCE